MGKLQLWSFPFTYLCAAFNIFYGIEITWYSFSCFFRIRICQGDQQQSSQASAQGLYSQSTNDSNLWGKKKKGDMVIREALRTARTGALSGLFHQRFSFPLINILRTSAPAIGPRGIVSNF